MKKLIILTQGWGGLTLVAGLFAHLALTDIYHAESEVSSEWVIVQIAALIILVFIALSTTTLWIFLKKRPA